MSETKRPEALAALSGRVVVGQQNGADSTRDSQHDQAQLAVIRKNALEEIRVGLCEFNGHDLVNIRIWAEPRNGDAERIPTKAGIACRVALLPEIIEALQRAEAEARARGLLQ
jgi:adenylosuccinate lyase